MKTTRKPPAAPGAPIWLLTLSWVLLCAGSLLWAGWALWSAYQGYVPPPPRALP